MQAIILQLIAAFGIPLARQISDIVTRNFEANEKPTKEMWDELEKLENASHAKFISALKEK